MQAQQKETKYTKLFVGGLPYHTTDAALKEYFYQFGDIDEAVVIHDKVTKKSKGYGFVTMTDKDGADRAIEDPNPVIDGRRANVNLAYLGAKPKLNSPGSPMGPSLVTGFAPFPGPQHSPPPNNNGLPFLPAMQPVFFDVPPFGGPPGPFYAPFGHMYPMYQPSFGYVPPHAAHQQQMFPYPAAAAN